MCLTAKDPFHGVFSCRPWRAWTVIFTLLVLGGCSTLGPEYERPNLSVNTNWIEHADEGIRSEEGDHRAWWSVFDDPVLTELIEAAYTQNLSLRIAGIRVLEARAQLGIAVGGQYPQVQSASGSAGYFRISDNVINGGQEFRAYSLAADAVWELDFWGRFRRGIESADASLFASVADYDDVLVTLIGDVANIYSVIRTFEERLQIARQNVEIQRRSLRITDVRFRNGLTTELDVQQARALLRNTEATIPRLEIGLRQAENALSVALGLPPGQARETIGDAGAIPTPPAEAVVGVPADLLRRRPDVRQAELRAIAQGSLIGVAEADLYPSVTLFGSIGLAADSLGNRDITDLLDTDSVFFQAGPSLQWNFLNYGRIKNQVRVQDARFQQALVNYQDTTLQAARESEDAMIGFLKRRQEADLLEDSVNAARRSVDLALIQYRDGSADYTRVLNTQELLLAQQDALTAARGEIVGNLIALYKALGGGWELRGDDDFVNLDTLGAMRDRTDWGRLLDTGSVPAQVDAVPDEQWRQPDW